MTQGIINVLKPPGMTSHDVVSFIRRQFQIKRVGHAGTLDPAAAGVLPVYLGQATRLIEYAANFDKSYRVELTVGKETDTGDEMGNIIRTAPCQLPNASELTAVLQTFVGESSQIPPMYSAVKIDGKKLYEYAREGIIVDRKSRDITIYSISLLKSTDTVFLFDVICSKGTYVRTLCADIGKKLNCPAVMSFLLRTRVGCFSLEHALTLEEITAKKLDALLPIDSGIGFMPAIELEPEQIQAFFNGQQILVPGPANVPVRFYDTKQKFLGIAQKTDETSYFKPLKVLKDSYMND